MAKRLVTCQEVNITHSQMLQLRTAGLLNLGMNNDVAMQIANMKGVGPKKSTASAAFHFWTFVALGVFLYSVFLSFTSSWWWFIPGLFGMTIIMNANKKGNTENLLDAAEFDEEFYERVRLIGGWLYQIEDSETDKFKL